MLNFGKTKLSSKSESSPKVFASEDSFNTILIKAMKSMIQVVGFTSSGRVSNVSYPFSSFSNSLLLLHFTIEPSKLKRDNGTDESS